MGFFELGVGWRGRRVFRLFGFIDCVFFDFFYVVLREFWFRGRGTEIFLVGLYYEKIIINGFKFLCVKMFMNYF